MNAERPDIVRALVLVNVRRPPGGSRPTWDRSMARWSVRNGGRSGAGIAVTWLVGPIWIPGSRIPQGNPGQLVGEAVHRR